jgi:tryptophanyl-tRNA synthetase
VHTLPPTSDIPAHDAASLVGSEGYAADPGAGGVRTRLVTGLQPTGRLHVGNYLGAVRPLLALATEPSTQTLVFVADLHAMTMEHDPARLRAGTRELAAMLLACGVGDLPGGTVTLFLQSAVPAHAELAYLLECTAAYGEMKRMIQFKEKAGAQRDSARLSLLTYPALMAADILLYRADVVPVGDDQRQHLELTRTLARRFNARYGEVFTVPSAAVPPAAARVRSLRDPAAKMGKSGSAAGAVHLLDDPVRIAATVRSAVTDLDPVLSYDPELRPGVANLADLLAALTGGTPIDVLAGLRGAGALKTALTEVLVETLRPIRARYEELAADPAELDRRLAEGAVTAAALAAPTLAAARAAVGLPERQAAAG